MTLDQIALFVKSAIKVEGRELAAQTNVVAMGSRADKDGLSQFVKALESR